jgi:hypothetical protein
MKKARLLRRSAQAFPGDTFSVPTHWWPHTKNKNKNKNTKGNTSQIFDFLYKNKDRLCGLVLTIPGYRYRGPGFDSRRCQIFRLVGLERGPFSSSGLLLTINKMTWLPKFHNIHPMRAPLDETTALYMKIPKNSSEICKIKLSFIRNFLTPLRYAFYK